MSRGTDSRSDSQLLVAARRQPDAFAIVYRRHVDDLLRFFARRGFAADQALDLTAEVFAAALEGIDGYEPGPQPGAAWLYGIARNVLRQSARSARIDRDARLRLKMDPLVVTDEGLDLINEIMADAGQVNAIDSALETLPEAQREAVVARVVDDLDYPVIARQLGCSEHLVRQRVSRGLRRLRDHFQGVRP